ncbi:MAG: hypothetical protein Q4B48_08810, partial [Syntrophomonadaceae bacterium]|nr:hypothetical protein [Syntrophomonadaceae bacterium]
MLRIKAVALLLVLAVAACGCGAEQDTAGADVAGYTLNMHEAGNYIIVPEIITAAGAGPKWSIDVYREAEPATPVQTFEVDYVNAWKDNAFTAEDINFDGYPDFRIAREGGGVFYRCSCFVFEPESGGFVRDVALEQLGNPVFDAENKLVFSHTPGNAESSDSVYAYLNGQLTEMARRTRMARIVDGAAASADDVGQGEWLTREMIYTVKDGALIEMGRVEYADADTPEEFANSWNRILASLKRSFSDIAPVMVYDPGSRLADYEVMTADGVRPGMTEDEALALIGEPEEVIDNAPGVRSILKDGIHYGFYQIDDSFSADYPLPRDGNFYLLNITAAESCFDPLPRGIYIGDDIYAVLGKFPSRDSTLRQWAHQMLYGQDEAGAPRAFLQFTTILGSYRLHAVTENGYVMTVY